MIHIPTNITHSTFSLSKFLPVLGPVVLELFFFLQVAKLKASLILSFEQQAQGWSIDQFIEEEGKIVGFEALVSTETLLPHCYTLRRREKRVHAESA